MGTSAVQFKLMPQGLEVDLKKIVEKVKTEIARMGGRFSSSEEVPIAFGLKAIVISLAYPETQDIDLLGNELQKVEGVSSVEMTDYRRALG